MVWPILVWASSLLLFSLRLKFFPLSNWDEAWYGEIIKNMATGKYGYLIPYWNGQYYFDKPPLYFWLTSPIFKLFGNGEWQERIIAVLFASLAVLFVYLIGRKLFSQKAALFSTLIFVSLGQVWLRFSSGDLDSLEIALFFGSIYFFILGKKKSSLTNISGILIGLSFLVKSYLLGLFPLVFAILFSIIIDRSYLKNLLRMFIVAIITSGWWYLAGAIIYGKEFINWYIFSPSAGNLSGNTNYLDPQYLKTLIADIGFWLVPLISIFIFPREKQKNSKLFILFISFISIYFVGLQISSEKYGWYLLPIYPLLAILLGSLFSTIDLKKNKLFLVILVLSFIGQIILLSTRYLHDPDRSMVSANLAKFSKEKIKSSEVVVLDDPDFSGFIYYSDFGKVVVVSKNGGKSREPWIISYEKVKTFPKPFWLITQDWQKFNLGLPKELIKAPNNYQLVKFDTLPIKP